MKTTVYLDVLISVNIVINYFLLKSISVLSGIPENRHRIIVSSIIGSFFSLFIFAKLSSFAAVVIKCISFVLSAYISFDYINLRSFIKVLISMTIVNSSFTGLILLLSKYSKVIYANNCFYYIGINPTIFVTAVVVIYFSITIIEYFFISNNGCIYDIKLSVGEKAIYTKAFFDTGFKVRDILTHRPVMLTDFNFISENMPDIQLDFLDGYTSPVFYSDMSGDGMLPCIKVNEVIIGKNKIKDVLLAVCSREIMDDAKILFGKDIYNLLGD